MSGVKAAQAASLAPRRAFGSNLSTDSAASAEVWHDAADGDSGSVPGSVGDGAIASMEDVAAPAGTASLQRDVAEAVAPYLAGSVPLSRAVEQLWALASQPDCSLQQVQDALTHQQQQHAATAGATPTASVLSASSPANLAAATALQSEAPPPLVQAQAELAHLATLMALLEDEQPPWQQLTSGQLVLHYMYADAQHAVKGATIVEEPLVNGLALAREIDLVPDWNGAFSGCECLAELNDSTFLVHQAVWTPWPIAQPEAYQQWMLLDLLHTRERCIVITCADLEDRAATLAPTRLRPARRARLHLKHAAYYFRPLAPHPQTGVPRTVLKALIFVDTSVLPLPSAVLQFVLRVFCPLVHRVVNTTLRSLFRGEGVTGSPTGRALATAMAARPLYARVVTEVADLLRADEAGSDLARAV